MSVKTCYTPSTTGYMHIGNLRTALFAYLLAKHEDGIFMVRVGNTDPSREVKGSLDFMYNIFDIFGLVNDEGPSNNTSQESYFQSERNDIYLKYAEDLVRDGKAYYCFCSEAKLDKMRIDAEDANQVFIYDEACYNMTQEEIDVKLKYGQPYVIRLHINNEESTSFKDEIYGDIRVFNNVVQDPILIRSDNTATYNFANVIDDHLFGVTHVVRGCEYLSSMPIYIRIYEALNWELPKFVHVPLILKANNKKISKRINDDNVLDLINVGFLPEAILNYIVLLGWSPNNNQEFFNLEELIKVFDYKGIVRNPALYDIKKLEWYNKYYISKMNDDDYLAFVKPFLVKYYDVSDKSFDFLNNVLLLFKNRIKYGLEIISYVKLFFIKDVVLDDNMQQIVNDGKKYVEDLKLELSKLNDWNLDLVTSTLDLIKNNNNNENTYFPIRVKLTGEASGIDLANIIYILGKDEVLRRLES